MIQARGAAFTDAVDQGLRSHMISVYNYMAGGLALSGGVAATLAGTGLGSAFFEVGPRGGVNPTALGWVGMIAPLAMILLASFKGRGWSASATKLFYWAFTAAEGVSISLIAHRYGGADVTRAFLVTASGFAALSIWGYTSPRDLSGVGSFCVMGLFGMIAASLVCALTGAHVPDMIYCTVGVIVFSGLTAWDTQKIKAAYSSSRADGGRDAVWGALQLYLDFLNLFMLVLRMMRGRD